MVYYILVYLPVFYRNVSPLYHSSYKILLKNYTIQLQVLASVRTPYSPTLYLYLQKLTIDFKNLPEFLYRNFKDYKIHDDMSSVSNQPFKLYGTAKTHKFEIIDQKGTFTYKAAKIIPAT